MTMDYSPWVEREIWSFLKVAISPKPKRARPPKLVWMHVTCLYLHEFFEPIILLFIYLFIYHFIYLFVPRG